jgi:hypothetical protein
MARRLILGACMAIALASCSGKATDAPPTGGGGDGGGGGSSGGASGAMAGNARIAYLHHSTGGVIWGGGVASFITSWNASHGTSYTIQEVTYPATTGGYPWENYPYDYWNLWVNHAGASQDRGELNLDQLAAAYDVIVWKHCFPVSGVQADTGSPSVSSSVKTAETYKAQYLALRARLRQFPAKRFVVWTGAALVQGATDAAEAERARGFFAWVKDTWDEPGDNVFVWDFRQLETGGGLYLLPAYAASTTDSHPNATLASLAAPLVGKRVVDVVEGRGDTGSLTGQ